MPGRTTFTFPQRPSDVVRSRHFDDFFRQYYGPPFSVRTGDGWSWSSSSLHPSAFTATFSSRERLDAVIGDATEATLAQVFLDGDLDIQGDFSTLLSVAAYTLRESEGLSRNLLQTVGRISLDISRRLKPGKKHPALVNWRHAPCTLNLAASFFEPWLGATLAHSCAFFSGSEDDLDSAQSAGLDHALAALHIERGDRLLDVSCGWGALLLRAAADSGCPDVHGVTSSDTQSTIAGERITDAGLERRALVECRDLRAQPYRPETFDKIADLSVLEQVPASEFADYLAGLRPMLVPGGLLLIDRLTRPPHPRSAKNPALNAEVLSEPLSRDLETAEAAQLEVLSVDSLQPHYERTLRSWIQKLRRIPRPSDRGHRCWMLFLVQTIAALDSGDLQAHRILLRRPQSPVRSAPSGSAKKRSANSS